MWKSSFRLPICCHLYPFWFEMWQYEVSNHMKTSCIYEIMKSGSNIMSIKVPTFFEGTHSPFNDVQLTVTVVPAWTVMMGFFELPVFPPAIIETRHDVTKNDPKILDRSIPNQTRNRKIIHIETHWSTSKLTGRNFRFYCIHFQVSKWWKWVYVFKQSN